MTTPRSTLRGAAVGIVAARATTALAARALPARDRLRTNYRGREVDLSAGVGAAVGAAAGSLAAGSPRRALLALGAGGLGLLDDVLEPRRLAAGRTAPKGLAGHLAALRAGRPGTGALKLVGIPVLGVAAHAAAPREPARPGRAEGPGSAARRRPWRTVVDGGVVAGTANLVNLLDLRPGRALKATALLSGGALPAAAPLAAVVVAALPGDLAERTMLGDCGANALGAAVGDTLVERLPATGRLVALAGLVALTLASERISFSAVIARTPVLAALDSLGREGER